jgi:hypothetical protein
MSVGARALKWQQLRAYAGPTYGPPQTVKIYSDPGSGLTTVDGHTQRTGVNELWAVIHDSVGLSGVTLEPDMDCGEASTSSVDRWQGLARAIMTFDLSVIPTGSDIQSARFCGYGYRKTDTFGYGPQIALYQSYPLADDNVVAADYQRLYNTELSNVINYADFLTTGFNYFVLNEAGLALLIPGQICRLGLREAKYDAPGGKPVWKASKVMLFEVYSRDYATASRRPYLEVTYRPLL